MTKFKWVTQAFSQPFKIQKNLFPHFVNAADQLAVEWEVALDEMDDSRLANIQRQMIKELDDYILSISGVDNLKYWNDDALCHSQEWEKMRVQAKAILNVMGWDHSIPPESGVIYIGE